MSEEGGETMKRAEDVTKAAVLGAGMTQPDMIAGTMAHNAIAPLAKRVVALLKEKGDKIVIDVDNTLRTVNPMDWPDDMRVEVNVGVFKFYPVKYFVIKEIILFIILKIYGFRLDSRLSNDFICRFWLVVFVASNRFALFLFILP